MRQYLTFAAVVVFFAGAGFLVTPTGLLALVVVLGPRFAPVFAVAFFFGATASGTVSKILGLELPVYICSARLDVRYAPAQEV